VTEKGSRGSKKPPRNDEGRTLIARIRLVGAALGCVLVSIEIVDATLNLIR
jgi:hypothetical protein